MKYFVRFSTGYPLLAILFCLVLTGVLGYGIRNLEYEGDLRALLPQDWDSVKEAERVEELFGASEVVLVVLQAEQALSAQGLEALAGVEQQLEQAGIVYSTVSLASLQDILGQGDRLVIRDFIQQPPQTPQQVRLLEQRIADDPLIYGGLVAKDFSGLAVVGMIKTDDSDEVLLQKLETIVEQYDGPGRLFFSGLPPIRAYMTRLMRQDLRTFLPLGFVLMIALLFFSFRTWRGVLLPLLVVAMSIASSMGLMSYLGIPLTVVGMLLPVMMIAIANDYGIHLVARYTEDVPEASGTDRKARAEVAARGLEHVIWPIMLAAGTTILGFLSLISHMMPPAKELGMLSAFGIFIAIVYSCLFIPAWLTLLPIPKRLIGRGHPSNRPLAALTSFCVRHPLPVVAVFVGMFLAFSIGILHIKVDANPLSYFEEQSQVVENSNAINAEYGGAITMSVLLHGDLLDPHNIAMLSEFTRIVRTWPEVGAAESIADYLERIHVAINPEIESGLPQTREQVYEELDLYSFQGGDSGRLIDFDFKNAQVLARLTIRRAEEFREVVRLSNRLIGLLYGPDPPMSVTGYVVMLVDLTHMVVNGQVRSLLLSLLMIMLCAALFMRSLRAGLLALGPLALAVVMVLGIMGFLGIELNMVTAMLTSIVVGVGVDYTVHYLWRYREERRSGANVEQAAVTTATTTGLGIVTNALSVIVGFAVLLTSNFVPLNFFGWLITLSILTCLLGAFCLLPALFGLGIRWPRGADLEKRD
ncbi:MAG: MMPL family transporter [Candidatus Alcyoniella australis]|nr:MMPL family transporter [Candidatus Alcyoniella australis]